MHPTDFAAPAAFFSNGVGDSLLALPALRALATIFPNRLTLICEAGARQLGYTSLPVRRIVVIEPVARQSRQRFAAPLIASAASPCDLFLSLVPWSSSDLEALVAELAPRNSIGFAPYFNIELPRDFSQHTADLTFAMPRALDNSLHIEQFADPPPCSHEAWETTSELLALVPPNTRILTAHCDTQREKTWPIGRFEVALNEFLEHHRDFVALIVGMTTHPFTLGDRSNRIVPCVGLPLDITVELIAASDLFVGVDSFALHVADLHRVPGVGLFGPTSPDEFGFRFGPGLHLRANGDIDTIAVDDVVSALASLSGETAEAVPRREHRKMLVGVSDRQTRYGIQQSSVRPK